MPRRRSDERSSQKASAVTEIKTSAKGRILCVLGPTNTGKTHLAVERMLSHRSGIIGLPLRLLARFEHPDRAAASRAEHAIKQLTPARKRALCAG